jgi:signal peptidase II
MPSRKLHSASSAPANCRDAELRDSLPKSRFVVFFFLAAAGCLADLLTKHWVFQWRGLPTRDNEWWVWEPYFGIETALNTGALFGMGAGRGGLFALLSVVAVLAILSWLFLAGAARDRWLTIALGCVMGGILGNLYDRLGLWAGPHILDLDPVRQLHLAEF